MRVRTKREVFDWTLGHEKPKRSIVIQYYDNSVWFFSNFFHPQRTSRTRAIKKSATEALLQGKADIKQAHSNAILSMTLALDFFPIFS